MFKLIREDSGVGIVCAVSGRHVFVTPLPPRNAALSTAPARKTCAPKAGCGSCGGCASLKDGYAYKFRADVENSEKFKTGDRVAFSRFVPEPAISSMLVFGFPVAAVVAVMLFWLVNTPEKSESPMAALSIAAAFFSSFIILGILDKLFRKKYPVNLAIDGIVAIGENYAAANAADGNMADRGKYPTSTYTGSKALERPL